LIFKQTKTNNMEKYYIKSEDARKYSFLTRENAKCDCGQTTKLVNEVENIELIICDECHDASPYFFQIP